MPRVKLSEFRAKSLLVPNYGGISINLDSISSDMSRLDERNTYAIKVDQGIKKRGKQGLIKFDVSRDSGIEAVRELSERGFNRFIAEPMSAHQPDAERYVSFERTRDGIQIMYSERGGVDIEENPESVAAHSVDTVPLPRLFVERVIDVMNKQDMSFVEINPLVVQGDNLSLLDAAVLVDSAGEFRADWSEDDVVEARTLTESEAAIAWLNQNSPAAFSFRVLNPDGALWLLLSGGGASITIADEAMNQGKANVIGNYGEYSGGPSTEETYLYTGHVIDQLVKSTAPKKAMVIAGGVANFTDVKKTFKGIIQALTENLDQLHEHQVKVFVRRGGPNEAEGLAMMKKFLEENDLFGEVNGSDMLLTAVINKALEYIDA